MKKRGKKGQGLSITTMILLALGIIILVVIVLGFTKGWDYIFSKIGILPGGLEAAAQSCKLSVEQELTTSYCSEFKNLRIAGVKQYANCAWLVSGGLISIDSTKAHPECTGNERATFCGQLLATEKAKKKVNGELCAAEEGGED